MLHDLMYLELKSGCNDNGPAWIGYVQASKSGQTLYWNDHAFQKYNGVGANYVDIETGMDAMASMTVTYLVGALPYHESITVSKVLGVVICLVG